MEPITIDYNGWIDPTCPFCECVMEFNYTNWVKSGTHVFQYPDLNMYCRLCHYAVHIKPAVLDAENIDDFQTYQIECYNRSKFAGEEE